MRTIFLILPLVLSFCSITIYAQNDYGRHNERTSNKYNNEKSKEDLAKEKEKNIEKTVSNLKNALQLDELQVIAVQQIITESLRNESIILKKEENEEDKMKAIKYLSETTDSKIVSLLSSSQKEKFNDLKENLKKKKK